MKKNFLIYCNILLVFLIALSVVLWFTDGFQFNLLGINISISRWQRPFLIFLLVLGFKYAIVHQETLKAKRKKILFASILLGFMLFVGLLCGEIFARYYLPPDPYGPVFRMNPHNWIQFSLNPNLKTAIRIDNGSEISFHVNAYGYRGPEILDKKPDQQRILCLGDSFLMGKDVSESDTLPAQLEKITQKHQVINAGCGGWNTVQEFYDFQERGIHLKPDMVLLFYVLNDTHFRKKLNPWRRFKESISMHSALYRLLMVTWIRIEDRLRKQVDVDIQKNNPSTEKTETPALLSMKDWNEDFQEGKKGWEESKKALTKLKALCDQQKIPFMVVLYPWLVQLDEQYPFQPVHQTISQFCQKESIPFFDLFPYYKGHFAFDLWVGEKDSHPNAQGQKIAAEAVYHYLVQQGWLKP